MNDSGRLFKNTVIYAIGDILPKIFSFITFPILTNALLPAEYGILNYINSIDIFLTAAGLLCLNTYYLVYYFKVGNETAQKRLLGNLSLAVIANFLLISGILFIFGPWLFKSIGSEVSFYPYIAIGVATSFFSILSVLPSALYRVRETPLPLTIINLARGFVVMILTIVAVYSFKATAVTILWVRLFATAAFGILFGIITVKNSIFVFDWTQLKHALKFSLPLVPATLATYLYSMFDKILIEKYLSLTELGLYSTASTLAFLLNIISYGAYKAFEPYFFKTFGSKEFDARFEKVRDVLLCVILIGGLCIAAFSTEFLQIFSSDAYWGANRYIPFLIIGAIAYAMSMMYTTVVTAREKTKTSAAITIIGALISIALDIVLLAVVGIWAAVFVSALSYVFLLYANMFFAKVKVSHLRPLGGVLVGFGLMYVLSQLISIDNIICSILVKILIICITSLFLLRLFRLEIKGMILLLKK